MDFALSDELAELKERTERFVREQILPYENNTRQTAHGPAEELRRELVGLGRRAGLLSPHVGREWGGFGLDHRAKAVVFEAAGYSPLGRFNCFAPDEANMHLLEQAPSSARRKSGCARSPSRNPLVLHDDRARIRRWVRPVHAARATAPNSSWDRMARRCSCRR